MKLKFGSWSLTSIFFAVALIGLQACGGGGGGGGGDTASTSLNLNVSTVDVKRIKFEWSIYTGALLYKLFVNHDGASGYSLLQDNITSTSTTITLSVHDIDWVNATYILEAHNNSGKLVASSPVSITSLMLSSIGYLKASNTDAGDSFGTTDGEVATTALGLSQDADTLAVGAYGEDSNAVGVNGTESNNTALNSGAVYIFDRSGAAWNQQAYIKASNTEAGDVFGSTVSLSDDGNTLAVGAYGEDSNATGINGIESDNSADASGAVYIFVRSGTTWDQQAYIKASNTEAIDIFGSVVSLSADGNTLAVGAYAEDSNATGINGDDSDNSADASGAVYIFVRSGTTWNQQAYIKASNTDSSDFFGSSLSLSDDGNILAIGAPGEDSNATGINGTESDNSVSSSGAAYIFVRSGTTWNQQAYIKASNTEAIDLFGSRLILSGDGSTLAVNSSHEDSSATGVNGAESDNSANASGAVYIFSRSGAIWNQEAYIKASNTDVSDLFGSVSLSYDGNILAVGTSSEKSNFKGVSHAGEGEIDNSLNQSGAVYIFKRSGTDWAQESYVKSPNTELGDAFGYDVFLSADGSTLVTSAGFEDSNATGISGDRNNNLAENSGAVYIY